MVVEGENEGGGFAVPRSEALGGEGEGHAEEGTWVGGWWSNGE